MSTIPALSIDNLDGLGPLDYSGAISAEAPFTIERTLNKPSIMSGTLEVGGLAVPARRARVIASAANGTMLFTGYVVTEPVAIYAGVSTMGAVYLYKFSAVSDEWLLDKQPLPYLPANIGIEAGTALRTLTQRVGGGDVLSMAGVFSSHAVGVFDPVQAATWSANVGALADAAYASYRVLDGAVSLEPVGTTTHVLNFDAGVDASGGAISIGALRTSQVKELANDVTVSGAIEPAAYIAETFAGDGATTLFQLGEVPFRPTAKLQAVLTDSFNEAVIDRQIWAIDDAGSHLSLTSGGLTFNGGTGYDGQTTLAAIDSIEMGGSLLVEAGNVTITGASQGIVCGLYSGAVLTANCFAGYSVRQTAGTPLLTPMINGVEVGTTMTMLAGHSYRLRIRLQCTEMQRVLQTYYATVDGAVEAFGGGAIDAPSALVFDVVDLGDSSNTPATLLYDGATQVPIAVTPAACLFAAVNSEQLYGSIGYVRVTQPGAVAVVSTLPSGTKQTRLMGVAGEGVDFSLSATGLVTFFAGLVPVAGETVTVLYRNRNRAVARVEDAASVAEEMLGAAPGTAQWLGKVLKPPSRSSMDCENAAMAVLAFATSRAAAVAGAYQAVNVQQSSDIWPGDVLTLTQSGTTVSVIVRTVAIDRAPAWPEVLRYKIAFANEWAEGLGLTLSEAIAADALLPASALTTTQVASGTVLANLQQLQLTSATTTALQLDTGTDPPAGGGFEVRRRDNAFGPAVAQDLVLRSPVRSFSIPREAQVERYFVRMYDGSTPPLYSRFSSAVFINLPVA